MLARIYEDLFKPHIHLASFLLRLGLAAIFIMRGYLKLSLHGGRGWSQGLLAEGLEIAVAWGETVGGVAMLFGFLSRLAAIGIAAIQVGAIVLATGRFDFVHIEYNRSDPFRVPTGAEYNVALITICLAILVLGSGKVSVDHLLFGRRRGAPPGTCLTGVIGPRTH